MASIAVARTIAARILRQRIRDRSAILFAIVTPLGLALAFAMLIPNEFSSFHTRYVVLDQDAGSVAGTLVNDVFGHLVDAGVADVDKVSTEAVAVAEVKAGAAGAAIVIPPGFSAAVQAGRPAEVRIVSGEYPVSAEIARSTVAAFASDIGAVQLMLATTSATGGTIEPATIVRAQDALHQASPIATANLQTENLQASLATFYGAAMAIMFVFFATQYGALAILADREAGTLNRLLAAPIRPAAIILGSSLAGFILGLVAMTVLIVGTTLLGGASWGPPVLVGLLVVSAVIAAMGISTLASTVARTPQQAGGLNAIIAISMSAVGGVFIPLSQAPELMASISLITPHAWFLRGVNTLAGSNPGVIDIAPSMAVLVAMGVVTGGVGLIRARRSLVA